MPIGLKSPRPVVVISGVGSASSIFHVILPVEASSDFQHARCFVLSRRSTSASRFSTAHLAPLLWMRLRYLDRVSAELILRALLVTMMQSKSLFFILSIASKLRAAAVESPSCKCALVAEYVRIPSTTICRLSIGELNPSLMLAFALPLIIG